MATKVIKLQDSNDNILIPVTDASVVQMSVEGQVKSVKDVIIENEEVTAAGYNNLNSRVNDKQDKLVAGDDATRLNGAKLSTKQIFTGSIDTIAGAVPMLLPAGSCIYNSADKKLYIGDSNSQPVEVAKPNDFLFFSNGKLYHYQFGNFGEVETGGTTLVAGDGATRINASALSTKQIYRGTVININGVPVALAVGAYCFNTATKKLYVGDSNSQPVEVPMPDDFLFVDTASGTTYRCDGTTLHNIANIKTINGQSLLGGGNVQLTGADFLLEQDAGVTINKAVNSNTKALQNKLDAANGVFLLQHDTANHIERFVVPEYWAANAHFGACCGVVVQVAGKIYVLAPVQVSLPWATSSQLVGAAVSNYFDAMLDLDGKAKTATIVSRYGSGTGYAAGYCNAYGNDAIEAGKWWLGSAGEWIEIGAMRAGVLRAYEMLGVSFGGSQNSSTEYSSSNFWYAQAMLDWCQQISHWRSKTDAGPTTPITRLR